MRAERLPIDPAELKRLYIDERLSIAEITTRLGYAGSTILRRLHQFVIDVRPRGPLSRPGIDRIDINWSPDIAYAVGLMATDGTFRDEKARCRWSPRTRSKSRPSGAVSSSRIRSREFEARLDFFTRFSGTTVVSTTGS
jgi:hypothetical protein